MRNTQASGEILRSNKRLHRTLGSERGSRTNSDTSRQIPARVIDAANDALPATGSAMKFANIRPAKIHARKLCHVAAHIQKLVRASGLLCVGRACHHFLK